MTHTEKIIPTQPGDIIGPERFGPSLWQGLHYITLGYPINPTNEQKKKYKSFFLLLQDTLPCTVCAEHYTQNLSKLPITDKVLETRENLVKWLIDFHNIVNVMKNKDVIDYKIARELIQTDKQCNTNVVEKFTDIKNSQYYGIFGLLLIIVIIYYIYKKDI